VHRLIHLLHLLAAAFGYRRLAGGFLEGIALITDVTFLVGPGVILLFTFGVATAITATHKHSPFGGV
jgi:hypothetical protein